MVCFTYLLIESESGKALHVFKLFPQGLAWFPDSTLQPCSLFIHMCSKILWRGVWKCGHLRITMVYVLILSFIPNITLLNISLFLATPLHFTTLQCSLKPLYSAVYILFSELQLYIWQSISTFLCTCAVSRVSCSTIPTGWHNYAITEICLKYSGY